MADAPLPRVLYSFPHPLGGPGIGTSALWQVRSLMALGVPVTVWTTSLTSRAADLGSAQETMRAFGRRIPHRAVGVDHALHLHDRLVARHLDANADRYDVLHAWPSSSLHSSRVARRVGVLAAREVPNTHTANAYEVADRVHRSVGVIPARRASHRCDRVRLAHELAEYDVADMLLVPSDYVRDTFLSRGFEPDRLARHQYAYDPDRFHYDPVRDPAGGPLTALFLGSCEPRKGLHLVLRAWVDSGAAATGRLRICGSFVPGYREHLAPLLAHPSVEVLPHRADVETLLQGSHILILPSLEEGSALVTYEAQACGCALVVSDAAGAVVRHGASGLMHRAGDIATLTDHLRRLAGDSALTARLRAGALDAARSLTWSDAGSRLLELYQAFGARAGRQTQLPLGKRG